MGTGALHRGSVSLEEIVAQDPNSAVYLPHAGDLLGRGMVAEATRLCEERRNRPGKGIGDHIVLGRCYLADGRLPEARGEFERALALDRENVVALKSLAGICSHEGNHAAAGDLYRAVCRVDPGDLESQSALHQITSGDYPEIRPPEVVVGQGDLSWQPIRMAREEHHLPELALGLRTLESNEAEPLRPSPSSIEAGRAAVPSVPTPILSPDELDVGAAFPTPPPAVESVPATPRPIPSGDSFQESLSGIDVADFQEGALERLDDALRPVEALPLGEVEPPPAPETSARPRSAIWNDGTAAARSAPEAPAPAAGVPIAAPGEPPTEGTIGVRGNRAAFETWLRELGGGA